jgi:hypothetical protein
MREGPKRSKLFLSKVLSQLRPLRPQVLLYSFPRFSRAAARRLMRLRQCHTP